MGEDKKEEILKAYFSEEGLNYSIGRTHIGSCDFSFGHFNYCDTEDPELKNFSLKCDEDYLIPFIKAAYRYKGKDIPLMGSTWSPPAWMKTNHDVLHGGSLKKEYYGVFADYLVKYVQAYRQQGIEISMLTVQNEAKAIQRWESCVYTAEQEQEFIVDYLYPALKKAGLEDVKIIIWDHNKERVFTRARTILSNETANQAVSGIAFHWYSGDHFENLELCREQFPDKDLLFTEGCVELTTAETSMAVKAAESGGKLVSVSKAPWEFGECYAHDMMGNFNHGMTAFLDWNLLLDTQGGPNHVNNFCSAPIMCDAKNNECYLQPSYCFIAHMSRYIPVGSKRIAHSSYTSDLEVSTFLTPEQKTVVVVLNKNEKDIPFCLKDEVSNSIADFVSPAKSISTLIY